MSGREHATPSSLVSPLRWPGAKRRFAGFVAESLRLNGLRPALLVETFCGGASVALRLLEAGLVERIGLIDEDPMVAAFWQTAFFDSAWLAEAVEGADVSLAGYLRVKASKPSDRRGLAFRCLYLNRTSFSGLVTDRAGPIGGMAQTSAYGVGCRFSKPTIAKRLRQLAALAPRVAFALGGDWQAGVQRMERNADVGAGGAFFYVDPPYVRKADRLYNRTLDTAGHERLRDWLLAERRPWILSYDDAPEVGGWYDGHVRHFRRIEHVHSARGEGGMRLAREVIASNLERLPDAGRSFLPTFDRLGASRAAGLEADE